MLALLEPDFEAVETNVEYDLEVEVSSNASKQEDTWNDDDEPEDAYANELLVDGNWLVQCKIERLKEQELDGLASVAISTGVEKRPVPSFFYDVLPQFWRVSFERCVHKFPDFPKWLSSSANKRKCKILF